MPTSTSSRRKSIATQWLSLLTEELPNTLPSRATSSLQRRRCLSFLSLLQCEVIFLNFKNVLEKKIRCVLVDAAVGFVVVIISLELTPPASHGWMGPSSADAASIGTHLALFDDVGNLFC
jgi:hypothetical protein